MYTLLIYIAENMYTHEVGINETRTGPSLDNFFNIISSFKTHYSNKKTARLVITILQTTDEGSIIHSHTDERHPVKEKIIINKAAMRPYARKLFGTEALANTVLGGDTAFTWDSLVTGAQQT